MFAELLSGLGQIASNPATHQALGQAGALMSPQGSAGNALGNLVANMAQQTLAARFLEKMLGQSLTTSGAPTSKIEAPGQTPSKLETTSPSQVQTSSPSQVLTSSPSQIQTPAAAPAPAGLAGATAPGQGFSAQDFLLALSGYLL